MKAPPPRDAGDMDAPFSAPPEWHAEMADNDYEATTMTANNGRPAEGGYAYRGAGRSLPPGEAEAALRNGVATARAARAASLRPPALVRGEVVADATPPAIQGAVKVEAFPVQSIYPFRQIADDGGIWKLDPAEFLSRGKQPKPVSVRQAAYTWAAKEGYETKALIDGAHVYVQFARRPS